MLAALIPAAWRWLAGLLVLLAAAGAGWTLGARAERGRLAGKIDTAVVARGQCEQRETDLQAQLRVAATAAADRQGRAAAAGRRPPPAPAQTITREIQTYVPTETDECRAAAGLLREYHGLVRRLRVYPDPASPGPGGADGAVPDARPGAEPAKPAPRGPAAERSAGRAGPGDRAGS